MHKYSYGKTKFFKKRKKLLGVISIAVGLMTILYFFFPLISYHIYLSSAFAGGDIETPIPQRFVLQGSPSLSGLVSHGIVNVTSDYKDARNWFPQVKTADAAEIKKVTEYQLTIPVHNIEKAKVRTDDFDLSKHLVQYFSTSQNPSEKGTTVIFGHSTLPQWFNPKNYMSIFAKLHLLKDGDEVILSVDGKDFVYKVYAVTIVDSDDPNIFSQAFDNSYLTIVTCTPPGTTWKRLIVRASLQS